MSQSHSFTKPRLQRAFCQFCQSEFESIDALIEHDCWGDELEDYARAEGLVADGGLVCDVSGCEKAAAVRVYPTKGRTDHSALRCWDCLDEDRDSNHFAEWRGAIEERGDLRTDGGFLEREDFHETEGGEGLPPHRHRDSGHVWLFTCVECGKRWADPLAPIVTCSCGGNVVGHQFSTGDYNRLRWYGTVDPVEELEDIDRGEGVATDGGVSENGDVRPAGEDEQNFDGFEEKMDELNAGLLEAYAAGFSEAARVFEADPDFDTDVDALKENYAVMESHYYYWEGRTKPLYFWLQEQFGLREPESETDGEDEGVDWLPERDLACKADDAVGYLHIGVDPACDPVGEYWIPVDDPELVEREHVPRGEVVQFPLEEREPEMRGSGDVPDHVHNWTFTGGDGDE